MLLQEPAESPYDVRFQLFGFPIRVAWSFWLGALIFGFYLVQGMDNALRQIDASPGLAPLYALWMFCMLVSITIHELGHALAFRQFGIDSSIVLYHFGGLAIPRNSFATGRSPGQLTAKQDLWVAFAGPLAQFLSAVLVILALWMAGYRSPVFSAWIPDFIQGKQLDSPGVIAITVFYLWPSVAWAILNLIPVWPLDGGRISRSLFLIFGGNTGQSLWLSLIAAGLMALYGFRNDQTYIGILFLSLAITNYQLLQQHGDWRY